MNGTLDIGAVETWPITLVNTTQDEQTANATTSLREAIANAASPGAMIQFDATVFDGQAADVIILSSGQLTIEDSTIIYASNIVGGVTIDADGASRVLEVKPGHERRLGHRHRARAVQPLPLRRVALAAAATAAAARSGGASLVGAAEREARLR